MSDFEIDRRGVAEFRRSREVGAGCVAIARTEVVPRLAANTPRDTGETAASTHAESADFGDRKGALVVQEGASVQTNFGNARVRAEHYANRI